MAILAERQVWHYPSHRRPALRFDGQLRQRIGFSIHPFESPVVPLAAQYTVFLFNSTGDRVKVPTGELRSFVLEPIRTIEISDGEREG